MLVQGIVGSPAAQSISPGTAQAMRLGQLGDVINSELHGRFYEQTYNRQIQKCSEQNKLSVFPI